MSDTQPGKQPGQSPAAADQAPAEAEGTTKTTVPAPAGPVDAGAPATDALTPVDPRLLVREQGFAGYLTDFKRRIKGGELGSIPVLVGLVVIWAIFETTTGRFLDPSNLTNIAQYIVGPGLIATGIVFVLLLGEIDLSVGSVAGLTAALTSVLAVKQDLNEGLAVLLGLLAALRDRRPARLLLRPDRRPGLRGHPRRLSSAGAASSSTSWATRSASTTSPAASSRG